MIFSSIFSNNALMSGAEIGKIFICMGVAFVLGLLLSLIYCKTEKRVSKPFAFSLVLLPTMVCAVISAVNGNIGTGIAIAGTFALVRFRSQQGTAKEIAIVYGAMAIGLLAATGYLFYTVIVAFIFMLILLILSFTSLGRENKIIRIVKISADEPYDFLTMHKEIFDTYADDVEWVSIKEKKGSYDTKYQVTMKKNANPTEFLKALTAIDTITAVSVNLPEPKSDL